MFFGRQAAAAAGPQAYDPLAAVQYGLFVDAAYSMYTAATIPPRAGDAIGFPRGLSLAGLGADERLHYFGNPAAVLWGDRPEFTDSSKFVLALRGTENPTEWFDNFTSIVKVPFQVAGCGWVSFGFSPIYDTLEIIDATEPAAGVVTQAAGSLKGPEHSPNKWRRWSGSTRPP